MQVEHSPGVCLGLVLPGKGIIRGRGFENDAPPTKTHDALKMLTDRNYTMFFNIENGSLDSNVHQNLMKFEHLS